MRKRTVRNGMRLVVVALFLIILASFYNGNISEFFQLSTHVENRIYTLGIFWATAIGSFGVVLAALGFALSPQKRDGAVRILPTLFLVSGLIILYFYLLTASFSNPVRIEQKRLRPGDTITI